MNGTVLRKNLVQTCASLVENQIVFLSIIHARSCHENKEAKFVDLDFAIYPVAPGKLSFTTKHQMQS